MKKKKKRAAAMGLLLVVFLAGCTFRYRDNYLKHYRGYLHLAFGDYEASREKRTEEITSPLPQKTVFEAYSLKYRDVNGHQHEFEFNNVDSMRFWVLNHAKERMMDMMEDFWSEQSGERYTRSGESAVSCRNTEISFELQRGRYNRKGRHHPDIISGNKLFNIKGKGLNFTDFKIQNLAKYGMKIHFNVYREFDGTSALKNGQYEFLRETLKQLNTFAEEYSYPKKLIKGQLITYTSGHEIYGEKYHLIYDKNKDKICCKLDQET